jgi:hypothetical protein
MFDGGQEFTINYQKLIESNSCFEVTKSLAKKLMSTPYMTVADFLKSLEDEDISMLLESSEVDEDDNHLIEDGPEKLQDLILIAEMLATAEGLDSSDSDETLQQRISHLISFLAVESLARKGFVKAYQKNMSFGEDMLKKIIAERIDDEPDYY